MVWRLLHDSGQIRQPLLWRHQRATGLKTNVALCQMRVGGVDIRRVAGDQSKSFASQWGKPTALKELRVADRQLLRIVPGQRHRIRL
ncbi:hypothetical protein D3C80_1746020 [compost metagenome]